MIYLLGLTIALLIVTGQVLWKLGLERVDLALSLKTFFTWEFVAILFSPAILAGIVSYGFATVLFMVLLSKFEYTSLQAVVVSSSLIFTFVAAFILFGEKISVFNIFGLLLLVAGVILVTKF